jgi:hypothetical protein
MVNSMLQLLYPMDTAPLMLLEYEVGFVDAKVVWMLWTGNNSLASKEI